MSDDLFGRSEDREHRPVAQKGVAVERLREAWSRRKWLALVVFAPPFVAAIGLIFSMPPLYRSTASVLVERQQVPEAFVRPTVTSDVETRLRTISQEVLSRSRLDALITRFGLYADLRKIRSNEEIVERMRSDIRLDLKGTDVRARSATIAFAVSYRGSAPDTVAQVTNTLASFFIEENLKDRERQAGGTADFLKGQVAETRKKLDDLETRVSGFRKRYLGELPQQMQANLVTFENLNSQLRLNLDSQIRAAERRDALTALLAEAASSPQAFGAPAGAPALNESHAARLVRLRQELASARARLTDEHPTVVRLKAQLAATEGEPPDSPSDATANLLPSSPYALRLRETLRATESDVKVLKAEEQRLRGAIAAYQARLENTPKREQEFQELSRDYEAAKQLYDSLGKRYEEAQLAESMEQRQKGERFRVLDPAIASQTPAAPNRLSLFLVSLVLSLGLAGGAAVLAEMLDTSFHSVNELREFSIVPVLVSIPRIVTGVDRRRQQQRFRLAAAGAMLGLVLIAGASYVIGHGNERLVQMLAGGGS
jgi:polysaccharide chain length determinant protein (PEP-CTERM system associated)